MSETYNALQIYTYGTGDGDSNPAQTTQQDPHPRNQIRFRRLQQQVKMIAHQETKNDLPSP